MKIHEAIRLRNVYGGETTLNGLVSLIQGNKIHRCPKCGGSGTTIKRVNRAQYPLFRQNCFQRKTEYLFL